MYSCSLRTAAMAAETQAEVAALAAGGGGAESSMRLGDADGAVEPTPMQAALAVLGREAEGDEAMLAEFEVHRVALEGALRKQRGLFHSAGRSDEVPHAGLRNQGATCSMNSLLQDVLA